MMFLSQAIGIHQGCIITLFLKCSKEMSLMILYGCKTGLLHTSASMFYQCRSKTLVIESSLVTFHFRNENNPLISLPWISGSGVTWNLNVSVWSTMCVRIQTCHKTLKFSDSFCYVMFAWNCHLRKWTHWRFLISIIKKKKKSLILLCFH